MSLVTRSSPSAYEVESSESWCCIKHILKNFSPGSSTCRTSNNLQTSDMAEQASIHQSETRAKKEMTPPEPADVYRNSLSAPPTSPPQAARFMCFRSFDRVIVHDAPEHVSQTICENGKRVREVNMIFPRVPQNLASRAMTALARRGK